MPRSRQYQAPQASNGQGYGQRGDQMQAQRQMPLPKVDNRIPDSGRAQQPAAPAAPAGPSQPTDVMAQAAAFDPGITPLSAGTTRPDEPVTAGLSTGPGPGPEVFDQPSRAKHHARALTILGQASGNDTLIRLAEQIRRSGGFL